jgi:bifunctional non-homologous end joining protein LigD
MVHRSLQPMRCASMVWTPEPAYPKPDISVTATTTYYEIVAPLMLPFIDRRLLNLFRCREGKCFFQRNREHPPFGDAFADPIRFVPVAQKNGRTEDYLYVENVAGIIACAKTDAVEFHGWGSREDDVERPDRLVIDLDPDEGLPFARVRESALQLRRSFDVLGLRSFALLTGGKGVHVIVPLMPEARWAQVRGFAKAFCTALAEAEPARFTIALPKAQRGGRIFLDFLRNQRTATAILPYSARARAGSPVAAPVSWTELERIERADHFSILDAAKLLRRADQRALRRLGIAEQTLPALS